MVHIGRSFLFHKKTDIDLVVIEYHLSFEFQKYTSLPKSLSRWVNALVCDTDKTVKLLHFNTVLSKTISVLTCSQ